MVGARLRELIVVKGEKQRETPDLVINKKRYKAELIPPALLEQRFFAEQLDELTELQAAFDQAAQELDNWLEEEGADEGLLAEAIADSGRITKASVNARLKDSGCTDSEERAALQQTIKLFDAESSAKKKHKDARDALDAKVFSRYPQLSEDEVKSLLVNDKWLAYLQAGIQTEVERITQQLAARLKELEERYAEPLPQLTTSVAELENRVAQHLKAMGLEWTD